MTVLNGTQLNAPTAPTDAMSNRTFATILTALILSVIITLVAVGLTIGNTLTNRNHAAVKDYVRTSVIMLNNNLNRGDSINYFAGTETLHGDHQTIRTHTTVDPIDKTHYTVSTTSLTDGYTVSYDSWHADYITDN